MDGSGEERPEVEVDRVHAPRTTLICHLSQKYSLILQCNTNFLPPTVLCLIDHLSISKSLHKPRKHTIHLQRRNLHCFPVPRSNKAQFRHNLRSVKI
jgi:hypothetical protein